VHTANVSNTKRSMHLHLKSRTSNFMRHCKYKDYIKRFLFLY
jgi:hypothetical protein